MDELYKDIDLYFELFNNHFYDDMSENNNKKLLLINHTKYLHDLLVNNANYIKISDSLNVKIDQYLNKYNDINMIILACEYILKDDFFEFINENTFDTLSDHNKSLHHNAVTLLYLVKLTLYEKYVEEYLDDVTIIDYIQEYKINPIIKGIKNIYMDLLNKINEDDDDSSILIENNSRECLMELLCSFDLEELFVDQI